MENLNEEEFLAQLDEQKKSHLHSKTYLKDMEIFLEQINEKMAKWSDGLVFDLQKSMKEDRMVK